MQLTELLNFLFGGTSLAAMVGMIYYRKQNRMVKDSEAKQSNIETQKQEMELADLYKDKVLELVELINVKQDKGNMNQDRMIQMLGSLDSRVDSLEARMGNVEGCLNGRLSEYLKNKQNDSETNG